jgi:(R,R)-butanediol dehydrogenase/meso-butanediol dehydrogenase/diacetyl reductase
MASMRVAKYLGDGVISIVDHPVPEVGPGDVLVEVSHCGVCGTDLHMVLDGMGRPNTIAGHEYSGRVVRVGEGVTGWAPGDLVVGGATPGCGTCRPCRERRPSLCEERMQLAGGGVEGAFAEFTRVEAGALVRVPDELPLRTAALAEPLAVALHALTRGAIRPGDRILVTGAGPLGLLLIAALRARGIRDITASEPAPARRDRAAKVGADVVVEPEALEAPAMPFAVVDAPFDVAFECSGNPRAMESALGQLRAGGTLVLVGTGMRRPTLDHNRILLNELVVTGAYDYDTGGVEDAIKMLKSGRLPAEHLIESEDVPLEGLRDAIDRLAAGELAGKVMISPQHGSESGPASV